MRSTMIYMPHCSIIMTAVTLTLAWCDGFTRYWYWYWWLYFPLFQHKIYKLIYRHFGCMGAMHVHFVVRNSLQCSLKSGRIHFIWKVLIFEHNSDEEEHDDLSIMKTFTAEFWCTWRFLLKHLSSWAFSMIKWHFLLLVSFSVSFTTFYILSNVPKCAYPKAENDFFALISFFFHLCVKQKALVN